MNVEIVPKPLKRKIVQITVTQEGMLVALCDDGSVWYKFPPLRETSAWERMTLPRDFEGS